VDQAFFDYVRYRTDEVPAGYTKNGLEMYRRLVYQGVDSMISYAYPHVKSGLSDEEWRFLLENFIAKSEWNSNFYGDLSNEFIIFLQNETATAG